MESDDAVTFIQTAKLKLTVISGYVQMLEKDVANSPDASERQREYIAKLRRLTDELVREIQQYESELRNQEKPARTDEASSPGTRGFEDAMFV